MSAQLAKITKDNVRRWEKIKGPGEHWRMIFNGVEVGGYSVVTNGGICRGVHCYFGNSPFVDLASSAAEASQWVECEWERWLARAADAEAFKPVKGDA